jgi:ribosomal protein S18 acetylase RimI-like enzyme
MEFQISEESIATLSEHAEVSISFEYDRILALSVINDGLGGFAFQEHNLGVTQTKDYDAIESERPASWSDRFDVSKWGFVVARANGHRIGGAVIAFDTAGVEMLESRRDLAVLWDIRVDVAYRCHGIGASLYKAAEQWSAKRKCTQLKVETQNINLAACKFYVRQGCTLGAVNRLAYPNLPHEIQMIWYKDLVAVNK